MTSGTSGRRSVNIYDYPEHLNPFFEDDNHTKLRFWTNTKRKTRSNSFSFQSIKDFKQSLFSRPTIRKRSGTAGATSSSLSQLSCYHTDEKIEQNNDEFSRSDEKRKSFIYPTLRKLGRSFSIRSKTKKRETSVDRTSSQNSAENDSYSRSTISSRQTMPVESHGYREPTTTTTTVTVTPLPRIRFHERLRNVSPTATDNNTNTKVDDTNPFKDDDVQLRRKEEVTPSTSKPATPPRKKKRAPPPPPMRQSSLTRKSLSAEFSLHTRELEDNTTNEINHKDIESSSSRTAEITKIEGDILKTTKTENGGAASETESDILKTEKIEISSKESEESQEPQEIQEIEKTESEINNEEPFQLTYNSELNISSSEISVTSETRLEQQQQQQAVEDSSDLLELVQKLQLEVEKLTDDTNNNIIASTFDSNKKAHFYGYDDDETQTTTTTMKTTEININLNNNNDGVVDDDDDVIIGAPLSPRLVRLKKDNEWIKH